MLNIKDNLFTLLFSIGYVLAVVVAEPNPLHENHDLLNHHQDGEAPAPRARVRRQYYVCPPDFERISSNCYYFSRHMATWQDALYDCIDRHSELAILQNPAEDKKLRGQLNKSPKPLEWWIGGIYDWEQMKWKWGASGKHLMYHGFSRMGPENKDKLKWHCTILDPTMKYKWSARSCVLGKHYICQKKVMRVGKRGLDKLRKKYNTTLNEVPAPLIYEKQRKPKKQQQLLKQQHQHNYRALVHNNNNNNAYGHRTNNTQIRKGKNRNHNNRKQKNRKNNNNNNNNKKNKNDNLQIRNRDRNRNRNGTTNTGFSDISMEHGYNDYRKNKKRNRRYKSKESKENNSLEEEFLQRKKHNNNNNNNSMEELTQKTTFMTNTLSPFHPQVIVEEHDFLELNNNN